MLNVFLTHTPDALENYYGTKALAGLRALARVHLNQMGKVLDTTGLLEQAAGCEVLVVDRNTPIEAAFFDHSRQVIAVHRCAVDRRNIDLDAASRNGVLVTHASPGFVDSVVELIVGMMVDLARSTAAYTAIYQSHQEPQAHQGKQLSGSRLGIIGYGSIGKRLAAIGAFMGMEVVVFDPHQTISDNHVTQIDWPGLLATSEFVACLAVATEETENLMDHRAFAAMKPGSYFINVSRGNLVDEAALANALNNGPLAGAALDVGRAADQKPSLALAALPNVIATPHIGGQTAPATEFQALETVAQVRAVSQKQMPHNALNPDDAKRFQAYLGS